MLGLKLTFHSRKIPQGQLPRYKDRLMTPPVPIRLRRTNSCHGPHPLGHSHLLIRSSGHLHLCRHPPPLGLPQIICPGWVLTAGRLGGEYHRPASRATAEAFASTRDGHAGLPALGTLAAVAFSRGSEFSATAARQLLCLTVRVYDTYSVLIAPRPSSRETDNPGQIPYPILSP